MVRTLPKVNWTRANFLHLPWALSILERCMKFPLGDSELPGPGTRPTLFYDGEWRTLMIYDLTYFFFGSLLGKNPGVDPEKWYSRAARTREVALRSRINLEDWNLSHLRLGAKIWHFCCLPTSIRVHWDWGSVGERYELDMHRSSDLVRLLECENLLCQRTHVTINLFLWTIYIVTRINSPWNLSNHVLIKKLLFQNIFSVNVYFAMYSIFKICL